MKKQVLVWLLAFGLVGFLVGCGGGNETSSTTPDQTTTNQNDQTSSQDESTSDTTDSTSTDNTSTDESTADNTADNTSDTSTDSTSSDETSSTDSSTDSSMSGDSSDFEDPYANINVDPAAEAANRDDHLSLSDGTFLSIPFTELPRYFLPNATEGTWESTISNLVFEFLMQTNATLENIPGIATSEWDPDTLTYTFHMRPGVKFHDGEELQCDDVMFSYRAWTHPQYPGVRFGNFENIVGAYDHRNSIFERLEMSDALISTLNAQGALPAEITQAYSDYGIDMSDAGNVMMMMDENGEAIENSWSFTAGGKEYYIRVHEGDIALRLAQGIETAWPIEGLNCVDNHTFQVTLDSVQRTFIPYAVASSGIMPQHIFEPYFEENGFDKMQGSELEFYEKGMLIGTGPYKFAEWNEGNYVKIVRNDDYWQSRNTLIASQTPLGGVEEIYFLFTPDQQAQFERLQAGEVDVLDTRPAVNQYFDLQKQPDRFNTYEYPQLVYDYFHWNLRNPLFKDVNVRKAMCYALDRQEMVDQVLQGMGEVANGPSHPLRWDWDETLREVHPSFDINMTIELMEGAGWTIEKNADGTIKDGAFWTKTDENGDTTVMEFEIATNQGNNRRTDYMVMMVEMFEEAGFKATTRVIPTNSFYNDYLDGSFKFETAIAGWRMGTDPDGTSVWHSKSIGTAFNWQAYSNPEIDKIIEEGLQYADLDKARPIYQEMNKMLVEDMGYCWLAFMKGTFGTKKDLTNLEPWSPLGPFSNINNWYWDGKGLPATYMEPSN